MAPHVQRPGAFPTPRAPCQMCPAWRRARQQLSSRLTNWICQTCSGRLSHRLAALTVQQAGGRGRVAAQRPAAGGGAAAVGQAAHLADLPQVLIGLLGAAGGGCRGGAGGQKVAGGR